MTTKELEQVILELLRTIYNADYVGKLQVTKEYDGFLIKLGMSFPEAPIVIYTELNGDKLIKFLKKELRDRNLSPHFFGYISLVYPDDCNNKRTKCCDKGRINR